MIANKVKLQNNNSIISIAFNRSVLSCPEKDIYIIYDKSTSCNNNILSLRYFVRHLYGNTNVTLVTFSGKMFVTDLELKSDTAPFDVSNETYKIGYELNKLLHKIDNIKCGGCTDIKNIFDHMTKLLKNKHHNDVVCIFMSDFKDTIGNTYEDIIGSVDRFMSEYEKINKKEMFIIAPPIYDTKIVSHINKPVQISVNVKEIHNVFKQIINYVNPDIKIIINGSTVDNLFLASDGNGDVISGVIFVKGNPITCNMNNTNYDIKDLDVVINEEIYLFYKALQHSLTDNDFKTIISNYSCQNNVYFQKLIKTYDLQNENYRNIKNILGSDSEKYQFTDYGFTFENKESGEYKHILKKRTVRDGDDLSLDSDMINCVTASMPFSIFKGDMVDTENILRNGDCICLGIKLSLPFSLENIEITNTRITGYTFYNIKKTVENKINMIVPLYISEDHWKNSLYWYRNSQILMNITSNEAYTLPFFVLGKILLDKTTNEMNSQLYLLLFETCEQLIEMTNSNNICNNAYNDIFRKYKNYTGSKLGRLKNNIGNNTLFVILIYIAQELNYIEKMIYEEGIAFSRIMAEEESRRWQLGHCNYESDENEVARILGIDGKEDWTGEIKEISGLGKMFINKMINEYDRYVSTPIKLIKCCLDDDCEWSSNLEFLGLDTNEKKITFIIQNYANYDDRNLIRSICSNTHINPFDEHDVKKFLKDLGNNCLRTIREKKIMKLNIIEPPLCKFNKNTLEYRVNFFAETNNIKFAANALYGTNEKNINKFFKKLIDNNYPLPIEKIKLLTTCKYNNIILIANPSEEFKQFVPSLKDCKKFVTRYYDREDIDEWTNIFPDYKNKVKKWVTESVKKLSWRNIVINDTYF